jgi:hypothetical protein
MLMKKKGMLADETSELILAVGAVIILIIVSGLIWSSYSSTEAGSSSYFKTFVGEIEKANKGNVGEFTMWQLEEDKGERDFFLIYFADKYSFEIGDRKFITMTGENAICVCHWLGDEAVCEDENCKALSYPVKYNNKYDRWAISTGDQITIEKVDEEYIIWESKTDSYSGPARAKDIKIGDIIYNSRGDKFEVTSSRQNENLWFIELKDKDGFYEGITVAPESLIEDYGDYGYRLEESSNE